MTIRPPSPPYVGPAAHDSGPGNRPIDRIVIHATVSPCVAGQARRTAEWFRNPASSGSAHYVVDPHETVQVVYDGTIAWHAPPNAHSIGVELCDRMVSPDWDQAHPERWSGPAHSAMLRRAGRLVARLALAYDVPITRLDAADLLAHHRGICGHVDVSAAWHESSHWDPGPSFPWPRFMRLVRERATYLREKESNR